jgi:hypothetical protein
MFLETLRKIDGKHEDHLEHGLIIDIFWEIQPLVAGCPGCRRPGTHKIAAGCCGK